MPSKEEPHQEHGQGKRNQHLIPGAWRQAKETRIGDTAAHEELQGDEVEGDAINSGGGGHGEEADGCGNGQDRDHGPDPLANRREAEAAAEKKKKECRKQGKHHANERALGLVLRLEVAFAVIVQVWLKNGGIQAVGCTCKKGQAEELGKTQRWREGGRGKDQQHQHRAVKGGGQGDPGQKTEELIPLESEQPEQFKTNGHPLTGIAHGHHSDEIGEGEGEGQPGAGLGATKLQQANREDQAANAINEVNISTPVGADPIEQAITWLVFLEDLCEGQANCAIEIGKIVEPIAAHLIAQADQQGEEDE